MDFLYAIAEDCDGGYWKIGLSDNPYTRLGQLQTANPRKLELIGVRPIPSDENKIELEKRVHDWFSADRQCGEWFKPSKSLLYFVEFDMMSPMHVIDLNGKMLSKASNFFYTLGANASKYWDFPFGRQCWEDGADSGAGSGLNTHPDPQQILTPKSYARYKAGQKIRNRVLGPTSDDDEIGENESEEMSALAKKQLLKFFEVANAGIELRDITHAQWNNVFRYMTEVLKTQGPKTLVQIIQHNVEPDQSEKENVTFEDSEITCQQS